MKHEALHANLKPMTIGEHWEPVRDSEQRRILNRASFSEENNVGSQEKGEDGRNKIVILLFPLVRCNFPHPPPHPSS